MPSSSASRHELISSWGLFMCHLSYKSRVGVEVSFLPNTSRQGDRQRQTADLASPHPCPVERPREWMEYGNIPCELLACGGLVASSWPAIPNTRLQVSGHKGGGNHHTPFVRCSLLCCVTDVSPGRGGGQGTQTITELHREQVSSMHQQSPAAEGPMRSDLPL